MVIFNLLFILFLLAFLRVQSECPNACSGHGFCGSYDMCTCYKGYMEGDCSLRACPFGRAHVDTPKGDLDGSLTITGVENHVISNSFLYRKGTTEQYPTMVDSDQNVTTNSAHEYVECSGKGICDRKFGLCNCADGYTGNACQKVNCPFSTSEGGFCSGHGVCETVKEIASRDNNNIYKLWDEDINFGCVCDAGYYGHRCEWQKCKTGFDPMYMDNIDASYRYSNWSYVIYTSNVNATITGNYSLFFYDQNDQQWLVPPLTYNATCYQVIKALEKLPNHVIPKGSVRCLKWDNYNLIDPADEPYLADPNPYYGIKYTLAFPRNAGKLKQLDINIHVDKSTSRPTLVSDEPLLGSNSTLGWFVYPNGFQGENTDYFHEKCINVDVKLSEYHVGGTRFVYLSDLTPVETRLLMKCLGDSDGIPSKSNATGRVLGQTFGWDYGTFSSPHIIKLVDMTDYPLTDLCGVENEAGQRGRNKLCNYGFPSAQNSDEQLFSKPRMEQPEYAQTIVSVQHPGDDAYYGPDTSRRAPGFLAALVYNPDVKLFMLMTKPNGDYDINQRFAVFTTTGTATSVSNNVKVFSSPITRPRNVMAGIMTDSGLYSRVLHTVNSTGTFPNYQGDVSCETTGNHVNGVSDCVEKNNIVFILDPSLSIFSFERTPKYLNMYTVTKVGRRHSANGHKEQFEIHLDGGMNAYYDESTNARIYNFHPQTDDTEYTYVSECSNRGYCDVEDAQCYCYDGFKYDACSYQYNPET